MEAEAPRNTPSRQRARILVAAEGILADRGADGVSVEAVCAAAGVPRETFASAFADRNELMLALFEHLTVTVGERTARAYRAEPGWLDGVRAAMLSLLDYLEAEDSIARFLIVESMRDERLLAARSVLMMRAAQALQADSPPLEVGDPPAAFGSEAVVATVVSVLHGRLLEDPVPPLRSLAGALMGLIVLPFLGAGASREELSRLSREAA